MHIQNIMAVYFSGCLKAIVLKVTMLKSRYYNYFLRKKIESLI